MALKFSFIDERSVRIIARAECLANRLLLLGDVLPELAGLLLERLHPRGAADRYDRQANLASPAADMIRGTK